MDTFKDEEWNMNEEQKVPVKYCLWCTEDIYKSELVYFTPNGTIHEGCFLDYAVECLNAIEGEA